MTGNKSFTLIWWIWGGALISAMVVFSVLLPLFGEDVRGAWEWFMPNLLPPMALVGGISYQQARHPKPQKANDGRSPSRFAAFALSILYLLLLTISVGGTLMVEDPLESLRTANLWLG